MSSGSEPGIGQACAHRRDRSLDRRRDDVGSVARHADAGEFGQDRRAARHGMLIGFEHRHARTFPEHQPVAVGREWPAGFAGDGTQRFPALEHAIDQRRIGAAREHDVGAAEPELVDGRGEGVVGGRAGRGDAEHRPAQAETC